MTSPVQRHTSPIHVSRHAVDRYQERVDPGASNAEARLRVAQLVSLGRVRPTPRWWMRDRVRCGAGVRFCYCASRPHVCAIIVDHTVVTVVAREMFRSAPARPSHLKMAEPRPADSAAERSRERWRWDGCVPDFTSEAA